jgi:hypothetical protein
VLPPTADSFSSRQLHDWQRYEGLVNRRLACPSDMRRGIPRYPGVRRRPASTSNSFRHCFPSSLAHYSPIQQRGITGSAMAATVCLDYQIFYTPPTTNLKPASRGLLAQNPPSSAVSGTPLRLPPPPSQQNAGGSQHSGATMPQNDVIKIPSDDEPDNFSVGNGRSHEILKCENITGTGTGLKLSSMARPRC